MNATILLTGPQGLLIRAPGDGWVALPQVQVASGGRDPYEIGEYLRREWKVNAICLFTPSFEDGPRGWHVLSALGEAQEAPRGYSWMADSDAISRLASRSDAALLREALEQMAAFESGKRAGPFARAGWLEEMAKWAGPPLAARGLQWNGRFRQFGSGPECALLRLETNGPAVWFKGVRERLVREYAITKYIGAQTPGVFPDILATHDEWRAWLMIDAEGRTLGECGIEGWADAARKLALVQHAYVGSTEKLLALSAIDCREPAVVERLDNLWRRLPGLMLRQPACSRAPRLSRDEAERLRAHAGVLAGAFFRTDIPMTLVHGDPNVDNFIVGARGTMILDWAESYIGHPFLSYEYLRMHLHRARPEAASDWEKEMREAYSRVWRPIVKRRDIEDGFALAPLIAPLIVAALALESLGDASAEKIPMIEAHIRSLARLASRALQPLLVEVTA